MKQFVKNGGEYERWKLAIPFCKAAENVLAGFLKHIWLWGQNKQLSEGQLI